MSQSLDLDTEMSRLSEDQRYLHEKQELAYWMRIEALEQREEQYPEERQFCT